MAAADPIPDTPCVGVCTVDDDGVCVGCRRTLDEIARWSRMPERERRRIMAELPSRSVRFDR